MNTIRQAAHVQMNGVKNVVTVSGLEENVKKAIALLTERKEKMEKDMLVNELNAAQVTELTTKGNTFLKEGGRSCTPPSKCCRISHPLLRFLV